MNNENKNSQSAPTTTPTTATAGTDFRTGQAGLTGKTGQTADLDGEIKKNWNKLTDDEVKLHADKPDQFFAAVKTKYGIERDEAQKRLADIKTACGCGSSGKAA